MADYAKGSASGYMVFKLTAHYLKMSFANLKLLSIVAVKKL